MAGEAEVRLVRTALANAGRRLRRPPRRATAKVACIIIHPLPSPLSRTPAFSHSLAPPAPHTRAALARPSTPRTTRFGTMAPCSLPLASPSASLPARRAHVNDGRRPPGHRALRARARQSGQPAGQPTPARLAPLTRLAPTSPKPKETNHALYTPPLLLPSSSARAPSLPLPHPPLPPLHLRPRSRIRLVSPPRRR